MSLTQLTDYVAMGALLLVAVAKGVDTAIIYYTQRTSKPVPKAVLTIDDIAKYVVAEYATFSNLTGAQKKAGAVQDLINQANKEGKPITEQVAKGAVQNAYNEAYLSQADPNGQESADDDQVKPIGFVGTNGDDNDKA